MISEWLRVMLEEIAGKKADAERGRAEEKVRAEEKARAEEKVRAEEKPRML
jgi:hypothetical protein